jgi:membrane dipeptidase
MNASADARLGAAVHATLRYDATMGPRRWVDAHLDIAYLAICGRDVRAECASSDEGCVSLPALRRASVELAFATIFTEPGAAATAAGYGYPSSAELDAAEAAGIRQLDVYTSLERHGELSIVRAGADVNAQTPLPRIVILMEGADPIRSPEKAEWWFRKGVRIVGLTWAAGTRYAGGNSIGGPLTRLGEELIRAFDELGMVHDVSHLSDDAFDGLMEQARGPVIASHSNCRALLEPKQRHLRDDQIKAIADREGMIGLNLYSMFLAQGRRATIDDCVVHVNHIAAVMGHRRGVGLGSDMDGGFPPSDLPIGLDHPTTLNALADALRGSGWSDDEIEGFAWRNWHAFVGRALPMIALQQS